MPRSGSWLLSEALHDTGVAGRPHEFFRPDLREVWSRLWRLSPDASIDEYIATAKTRMPTANGMFSVELQWDHLRWLYSRLAPGAFFVRAHAAELLEARFSPLQYVFLWRRDTARHAVSYYRATHMGESVDLQQIRWFEDVLIEHREKWRQYFAAGGIRPIEVEYESLVTSYEETVASLLSQLGIEREVVLSLEAHRTLRAGERTDQVLDAYLPVRDDLAPKGPEVRWDAAENRFTTDGQCARACRRS